MSGGGVGYGAEVAAERPPSAVSEAIDVQDKSLAELEHGLQILRQRLTPVLSPRPEPATTDGSPKVAQHEKVVDRISRHSVKVNELSRFVGQMVEELDI